MEIKAAKRALPFMIKKKKKLTSRPVLSSLNGAEIEGRLNIAI